MFGLGFYISVDVSVICYKVNNRWFWKLLHICSRRCWGVEDGRKKFHSQRLNKSYNRKVDLKVGDNNPFSSLWANTPTSVAAKYVCILNNDCFITFSKHQTEQYLASQLTEFSCLNSYFTKFFKNSKPLKSSFWMVA